jgi:hypothetical protein
MIWEVTRLKVFYSDLVLHISNSDKADLVLSATIWATYVVDLWKKTGVKDLLLLSLYYGTSMAPI